MDRQSVPCNTDGGCDMAGDDEPGTSTSSSCHVSCDEGAGQELRQKVREALVQANADGRLILALRSSAGRAGADSDSMAAVREHMGEGHAAFFEESFPLPVGSALEAVRSVHRSEFVAELSSEIQRERAHQILIEASLDGRLAAALDSTFQGNPWIPFRHDIAFAPPSSDVHIDHIVSAEASTETLRARVRDTLLQANSEGRLGAALAGIDRRFRPQPLQGSQQREQSHVAYDFELTAPHMQRPRGRVQAGVIDPGEMVPVSASLTSDDEGMAMDAAVDGGVSDDARSDEADAAVAWQDNRSFPRGSLDATDLRTHARETLVQASTNGRLAAALQASATVRLAAAARDALEAALLQQPGLDNDLLRAQARDALMQASATGRLAVALAGLHANGDGVNVDDVNAADGRMPAWATSAEEARVARARRTINEARERARRLAPAVPAASAMCTICLDLLVQPTFQEGEDASDELDFCVLPCLHTFHATCADGWLRSRTTCPNCRLRADSGAFHGW